MTTNSDRPTPTAWARFRFSVVGSLLSSPPAHGELKAALEALAGKTWTHPAHGREVHFSAVTIERWYYKARREKDDPVGVLRRALRKDCGKVSLPPRLAERLFAQYEAHKHWTYQLHYDNLGAAAKADPSLGTPGSYSTVRRYMQAHGMVRKPRAPKGTPGEIRAARRREEREVRSYEAEYVGALWHLDFHHGSLPVLTPRGQWEKPLALGILDDCSRLCCHLQWYLSEAAEDLTHGLSQGIQKRGLFRSLMSDNGGAMVADEVTEGLLRLGIVHERTLPYSPYQNGKQECFWATLEGRLMEMLEGVTELSLDFLNQATQAWVEDGVQPHAAPRDGLLAGRALRRSAECAPAKPVQRRPARRLPEGGQEAAAPKRRDDLPRGRALRDPRPLPPLPQRPGPLRLLGPQPRGSGRPPQRDSPGADLPSGPPGQCRRPTPSLRAACGGRGRQAALVSGPRRRFPRC